MPRHGCVTNWYQSMVTTLGLLGLMYKSRKEILLSAFTPRGEELQIEPVILGILVEFQQKNFFSPYQSDNYSYQSRDMLINIYNKT